MWRVGFLVGVFFFLFLLAILFLYPGLVSFVELIKQVGLVVLPVLSPMILDNDIDVCIHINYSRRCNVISFLAGIIRLPFLSGAFLFHHDKAAWCDGGISQLKALSISSIRWAHLWWWSWCSYWLVQPTKFSIFHISAQV